MFSASATCIDYCWCIELADMVVILPLQEPSTSRSDLQIEVRDPVKHGDNVSVRLVATIVSL